MYQQRVGLTSPLSPKSDIYSFCKVGDLNRVRATIKISDLHKPDRYGNTPLYYACLCGHLNLVKYLSELGARDDKNARCYMNALSLRVRELLRVYNSYEGLKMFKMKNGDCEDIGEQTYEQDQFKPLDLFMMKMARRVIYGTKSEESDLTIRIRFGKNEEDTIYYCHWWIILKRWPMLLYFALVNKERPIPQKTSYTLTSDELAIVNLKTKLEIEKYFNSINKKALKIKDYDRKIEQIKEQILVVNQKKNFKRPTDEFDAMKNLIPDDDSEIRDFFKREELRHIDLGPVPLTKIQFDNLLVWIYTGCIVRTENPKKCTKLESLERFTQKQDYCDWMESLGMYNFVDIFRDHRKDINIAMKESDELFKKDLKGCIFHSSFESRSKFEKLQRSLCNVQIKIENYLEEVFFVESTESILCHKDFLSERSMFFNILLNSNFDETERMKESALHDEIPTLEIQGCNFSVIQELCNFIYTGKFEKLDENNLLELFSYGHRLGFPENTINMLEERIISLTVSDEEIVAFCKACFPIFKKSSKLAFVKQLCNHLVKFTPQERLEIFTDLDFAEKDVKILSKQFFNQ